MKEEEQEEEEEEEEEEGRKEGRKEEGLSSVLRVWEQHCWGHGPF